MSVVTYKLATFRKAIINVALRNVANLYVTFKMLLVNLTF